jgi:hypothetical protein
LFSRIQTTTPKIQFENSRAFRLVFKSQNEDSKNTLCKFSSIPPCLQVLCKSSGIPPSKCGRTGAAHRGPRVSPDSPPSPKWSPNGAEWLPNGHPHGPLHRHNPCTLRSRRQRPSGLNDKAQLGQYGSHIGHQIAPWSKHEVPMGSRAPPPPHPAAQAQNGSAALAVRPFQ